MLLGHRGCDWDDALCPPRRRPGAQRAALFPRHDRAVWVGAVCRAAQRHHVDSSNAEEDGYRARLARSRGVSMARLTKADAARQLGIARATLYKLISQGKVSPTPDGLIDQAELIRVAHYIDTLHERTRTPTDRHERLQTSTDTTQIPTQEA